MKKFCIFALVLILCVTCAFPVMAKSRLVDDADLLDSMDEMSVLESLDQVSGIHGVDIVVATVDSLGGKSLMSYADDFYDYNGYGADGVLLLISMEDRDWYISTSGYGISAITDAGIEFMGAQITPFLSNGEYAAAFEVFAETCDDLLTQAEEGMPYEPEEEPMGFFPLLVVCIIIGFVVALIATGIMKSKLKSVRSQSGASDYVKAGSMQVTHRQDLFLYREVHKREKPKDSGGSSTHRSSSGRSHGGGGGKF